MNKNTVLAQLAHYQPLDAEEAAFLPRLQNFLAQHDAFWQRSTPEGHLTGSAWILSPDHRQVLLIHHAKLDRWFQPGGHADDTDADLCAVARREAGEECGLTDLRLLDTALFDLDIHLIPAKGDEPAHWHYDLRYAFEVSDMAAVQHDAVEIKAFRWVPVETLLTPETPASLRRMAIKTT